MFCPRCGQEQVNDSTRFCSRCGFLLETVAEVLANGGVLPQLLDLKGKKPLLTRKSGIFFGVFWFMFFVLILTPIWGTIRADELAGISAIIGVFGGLMIMIASLVFLKKTPPSFSQYPTAPQFHSSVSSATQNHLPPQQSQPIEGYAAPAGGWKAPHTGEFAKPPSVTEETTKLLHKDEK